MSESRTLSTITRADVDSLTKKRGEPQWLEKLRLSAFEKYFEADNPSTRFDNWRKTLVETVDLTKLSPIVQVVGLASKASSKETLEKRFTKLSGIVSQTSGDNCEQQLDAELARKGVIFTTIEEAVTKHGDLLKEHLERGLAAEYGKLSLMTSAFFTAGAFLYVPKHLEIDAPFVIVNSISQTSVAGEAIFPRIIVVADEGSTVKVVNVFEGGAPAKENLPKSKKRDWIFTSAIVDVVAKQTAHVHYLEVYDLSRQVFSVSRNNNIVGRDAEIYSLTAALGGGQLKSDIITSLVERGASADIRGVALADGEEHFYYNTVQNHEAPDTRSNINFRVALKDTAVSSYQGNIRVALNASKTDAYQSNKNLLLSETAKAESIPRLEILTDEVKCSHGATVGPVDKNQVFYLMSRGLTSKEAEEFIVTGFFNTIIESLKIEGAAEWIEDLIGEKIHATTAINKTLSGARA